MCICMCLCVCVRVSVYVCSYVNLGIFWNREEGVGSSGYELPNTDMSAGNQTRVLWKSRKYS